MTSNGDFFVLQAKEKLSYVLPHDSLYLLLEILFKIVAELLYLIEEAGTLFIV